MSKCEQCIVKEFSALKSLQKSELIHLASCKTTSFIKKGEVLFEEGETIHGVYCIKSGVSKLSKLCTSGKNQIVKLVKKGDLLGQRSMISNDVTHLSAIALSDMEVCFIPKNEILTYFNQNNSFSMHLIQDVCQDLKEADSVLVNFLQKSVKERLALTLLYLHETFGTNSFGSLNVTLSREDLASYIGTATENCIRTLSEFKKNNWIKFDGKNILILEIDQLRKLSDLS